MWRAAATPGRLKGFPEQESVRMFMPGLPMDALAEAWDRAFGGPQPLPPVRENPECGEGLDLARLDENMHEKAELCLLTACAVAVNCSSPHSRT